MNFFASHIYIEGNHCADKLANIGLSLQEFTWFNGVHRHLKDDLVETSLASEGFRFVV